MNCKICKVIFSPLIKGQEYCESCLKKESKWSIKEMLEKNKRNKKFLSEIEKRNQTSNEYWLKSSSDCKVNHKIKDFDI